MEDLFLADFLVYRDTRSIYKLLKSKKYEGDCALTRTLPRNYFSKKFQMQNLFVEIFSKLEYLNRTTVCIVGTWKGVEQ